MRVSKKSSKAIPSFSEFDSLLYAFLERLRLVNQLVLWDYFTLSDALLLVSLLLSLLFREFRSAHLVLGESSPFPCQ